MKTLLRRCALLLGTSFIFASCGDSAGPKPNPLEGTLSFDYTGTTRSGSYQARGELQVGSTGEAAPGTYVGGVRDGSDLYLFAFEAGAAPRGNLMFFQVAGVSGTGTFSLDLIDGDAFGFIGFDLNPTTQEIADDEFVYLMTSGTIRVTEITDRRVRGTFSGEAERIRDEDIDSADRVTIRNGQFDAPLRNDLRGGVGGFSRSPLGGALLSRIRSAF
ncbi:MAG: hypothetical protein M3409_07135 [Gemmatimonadota bacterium]|nr:hypothetical protein [Gemmatimonadota bacterium]